MRNVRFARPDVGPLEIQSVEEVIKSGWLTNGPVTQKFEERIALMTNSDRCVCFDSCTGALVSVLRLLDIGPGDEVITTPYTYTATAAVIHHVGAKIVFCDLKPGTFEMDYDKLAELITDRTKAVIPVDYGGVMCDYGSLYNAIGNKRHLFKPRGVLQELFMRPVVVADAAHSFGASRGNLVSGEAADFTCFSFHVVKVITTGGEGGAAVWRTVPGMGSGDIWYTLKLLGDHGQTKRGQTKLENSWEYDIRYLGYNHIMTDMDAAMGMSQLDRLEGLMIQKTLITQQYDDTLKRLGVSPMLQHLPKGRGNTSSMHLYPVRIPGGEKRRNAVYDFMDGAGIKCNVHYKPLPMFTAYKSLGYSIQDFPEAYRAFSEELSLPYHTGMNAEDVATVCDCLCAALEETEGV